MMEDEDDDELDDTIFTHLEKMHSASEGNDFYNIK
jgi:predicted small metal-binding protein